MPLSAKSIGKGHEATTTMLWPPLKKDEERKEGDGREEVTLTYNPAAITGDMVKDALEDSAKAGTPDELVALSFLAQCRQLPQVLKRWDVLARDPRPKENPAKVPKLEITEENLLHLPVAFVATVWATITEGERPPADAGSFGG